MEFLSQTYVALRGPTGAPQTATDTVARLSDRLSPATLLADRRAAIQSLKGLARDWKQDVGERALPGILDVLTNDAEVDADIGKAALETLNILCDVEEGKELGFKHTDMVLATDRTIHTLFALLADNNFYTRFASLQFLSTLLQNRRQVVQSYFLKASAGSSSVMLVLEDKREIIRNEAITMVQTLISQSADIQKVLAFEGAFEKLFGIVTQEGGVEGGVVTQEALACVDSLLRFNTSNQSYFRETPLPPALCTLLFYPPSLSMRDPAPQEFALQFWDDQKLANASLIVGIMGMLISSSKGNSAQEVSSYTRCLVELALASNAPTPLKTQALRLLPSNLNFPLSELVLTPYTPVPDSNGEEWDRLEPASALDVLVELALHGEYNSGMDSEKRLKDGLELRAAVVGVFENFVRQETIRIAILQGMLPTDGASSSDPPPITPLLHALAAPPNTSGALDLAAATATHVAALLFAHLLRASPRAKALARAITPPTLQPLNQADSSNFFIPADGAPPEELAPTPNADEDDPPQALLPLLSEHLSLAALARARADTDADPREAREWDRFLSAHLCLLSQWLWDEPSAVRDFLDAGGLSVLVDVLNQTHEGDALVPGLCAFLLGVCYEFNREPGEITRSTIHPILNRLGVETLAGRMARLREDERFRSVGPDTVVLPFPTQQLPAPALLKSAPEREKEGEIWFDWAFVDFWKSNYYTIQRGLSTAPDQLSASSSGQNVETAMLIASLREVIRNQTQEIETLQRQLHDKSNATKASAGADELKSLRDQVASLTAQTASLSSQLGASEMKRKDVEKEQEDLLVLLDEVTAKRKTDKARLSAAGLEVSEDEGDDDADD
ncbi:p115 like vesicle tethering protein [Mycena pura]|uniref:P115 like vesicle tethering protein n=1 Tax=Mycena pura TaxID=153505 RepID=A0AAD6Y5Z1_9AGAR|nr:p115 like vesicle tethering protein [Mycena pura]